MEEIQQIFRPKLHFLPKNQFLGLFLRNKINGKGGTPPIADGFFLKTNGKKLAEILPYYLAIVKSEVIIGLLGKKPTV